MTLFITSFLSISAAETYLKSPEFRRLALEIGGGVAGAMTGGSLYAASRLVRMAYPLLVRSLGAGVGEGAAAGLAQTFDPKEDLAKEQTYLDEITFKIDDLEEQIEEFGELPETPITFYSSMEDALQHMHNVTTLKEQR